MMVMMVTMKIKVMMVTMMMAGMGGGVQNRDGITFSKLVSKILIKQRYRPSQKLRGYSFQDLLIVESGSSNAIFINQRGSVEISVLTKYD